MKKFLSLFLCLLVLSLAGCKNEEDFSWRAITAPTAAPTPMPVDAERILRLSMPEESGKINPHNNQSQSMQLIMQLVFEPLVRLDSSGKPMPYLAESWTASEDGSVWTFILRKNIYFHDGSALTALDVSKTLDAIIAAGEESPWADSVASLISWSAQDDRTLIVRAKDPGYIMLYSMCFPVMRASGESDVVGTGPYKVADYTPGENLLLQLQSKWWKTAPSIKEISVVAKPSNESELATIELGELDLVHTRSLTASLYREKGVRKTQDYYTQTYDLLAFNFENPVLADATVRRAISMAIDRDDIVTNIYQNHAVTCEVPISPDNWLHSSSVGQKDSDITAASGLLAGIGFVDTDGDKLYDLLPERLRSYKEEKEEIDENGATPTPVPVLDPSLIPPTSQTPGPGTFRDVAQEARKPFTMKLLTNYDLDSPTRLDVASRIAQQLGQVGLAIEVETVSFDELGKKVEAGDYDLLLIGYKVPASGDLRFLLDSGYTGEQAGVAITHYADEQLDLLLSQVANAQSDADYQKILAKVQQRFVEKMPFIGLYFRSGTVVMVDDLQLPGVIHATDPFRNIEEWRFTP